MTNNNSKTTEDYHSKVNVVFSRKFKLIMNQVSANEYAWKMFVKINEMQISNLNSELLDKIIDQIGQLFTLDTKNQKVDEIYIYFIQQQEQIQIFESVFNQFQQFLLQYNIFKTSQVISLKTQNISENEKQDIINKLSPSDMQYYMMETKQIPTFQNLMIQQEGNNLILFQKILSELENTRVSEVLDQYYKYCSTIDTNDICIFNLVNDPAFLNLKIKQENSLMLSQILQTSSVNLPIQKNTLQDIITKLQELNHTHRNNEQESLLNIFQSNLNYFTRLIPSLQKFTSGALKKLYQQYCIPIQLADSSIQLLLNDPLKLKDQIEKQSGNEYQLIIKDMPLRNYLSQYSILHKIQSNLNELQLFYENHNKDHYFNLFESVTQNQLLEEQYQSFDASMKKGLSQLKELYKEKYYWSQPYLCRLLLDFKFDFEKVNNQININDSEKTITVGTDSFREIFLRKSYFVDKTMLISYLLSAQKAKAFAFIYFRRTGKTTNLSTVVGPRIAFLNQEED
ncbi:Hypothetical_protein [Hexamita inflata]|uniref:Hypothetical_protein n=1 Tax=Hexamita inflata TaxID=28002 RepID=A0AA86PPT7_9EUKA|nr:Hypothetical protein HINF_LOCUS30223 [Hexamita inflata]